MELLGGHERGSTMTGTHARSRNRADSGGGSRRKTVRETGPTKQNSKHPDGGRAGERAGWLARAAVHAIRRGP